MFKYAAAFFIFIALFCSISLADDLPSRYHTYQEILDTLTNLRDSHSDILYLDTLGYSSRDNIPILRLKISDNASTDEDEPAVFFDGGVHADEVLGPVRSRTGSPVQSSQAAPGSLCQEPARNAGVERRAVRLCRR